MATYNVNLTDGTPLVSIPDGADRFVSYSGSAVANIDPATLAPNPNSNVSSNASGAGLRLLGQNSIDYGLKVDENFVHILENFAANTQPNAALRGQLWYDTSASVLKVCTVASNYAGNIAGTFSEVGGGSPQGLQGYVQYNSGVGSFAASNKFVFDAPSNTLSITGNVYATDKIRIAGGNNIVNVAANVSTNNWTLTLPSSSGSNGQALTTDGNGATYWASVTDRIIDGTGNTSIIATSTQLELRAGNVAVGNITDVGFNFGTALGVTGNITGNNFVANANINTSNLTVANTATFNGTVLANSSVFNIGNANFKLYGGTTGQVLSTDGAGNLSWATIATSGLSNGTSSIQVNASNIQVTANGNLTTLTEDRVFRVYGNANIDSTVTGNLNGLNLNAGVTDGSYLATDGLGNLRWQAPGVGSSISNGNSSVSVLTADGNVVVTIDSNAIANFNANGLQVSNLTANINLTSPAANIGSGLLTVGIGTVSTTGNIDVAGSNVLINSTGDVIAANSVTVGNVVVAVDDIYANTGTITANAGNFTSLNAAAATLGGNTVINSNGISTTNDIIANIAGSEFELTSGGLSTTLPTFIANVSTLFQTTVDGDFEVTSNANVTLTANDNATLTAANILVANVANANGNVSLTMSEANSGTFTANADGNAFFSLRANTPLASLSVPTGNISLTSNNITLTANDNATLTAANIIVANVANANGNVSLTMSEANSGTFTANADGNAFFSLRANTPLASLSVPTGNISLTSNNITLTGRTTIGNLQATVTANADTPSGNLVTLTINGATYQLLAL